MMSNRAFSRAWQATLLLVATAFCAASQGGEVLTAVKSRGELHCGISEGIPGFSARNAGGAWRGLDIDFCRAVAAAVLGNPDKVKFVPLSAPARFPALQARRIDLLLNNTTWTLTREAVLRAQFPAILFYDGQGFMVPAATGISTATSLSGETICVERGTTHQRNLEAYFELHGGTVKRLVLESPSEAVAALFEGRCRAYTSDASLLAALRLEAPGNPRDYVILPERISKEPLSAVVWADDPEWATVVRWVFNVLILAEEHGVTRENLDAIVAEDKSPLVRRSSEERRMINKAMDLAPGWGPRVIRAVGNYGEIYERNLGRDSPLKIERGLNQLWTQGGLHFSPPID